MCINVLMSESQPFLSRHFLATTASTLGAVPFPPSGPEDSDGKSVHHNILCITGWNDDLQVRRGFCRPKQSEETEGPFLTLSRMM